MVDGELDVYQRISLARLFVGELEGYLAKGAYKNFPDVLTEEDFVIFRHKVTEWVNAKEPINVRQFLGGFSNKLSEERETRIILETDFYETQFKHSRHYVKMLVFKILRDPDAFKLLEKCMSCDLDGQSLLRLMRLENSPPESRDLFIELFLHDRGAEGIIGTVLDKVAASIEPEYLIHHITKTGYFKRLKYLKDPIIHPISSKNTRPFARLFLRELANLEPEPSKTSWKWPLVNACSKDPYNRAALRQFMPNYKEQLAQIEEMNRARNQAQRKPKHLDVAADDVTQCRPPEAYEKDAKPLDLTHPPHKIGLRSYQNELVVEAVAGENTLICAPTGSGKTVVAAFIAKHHLDLCRTQRKPARVVMVVPKIVLVHQQAERLSEYLRNPYRVDGMSGAMGYTDNEKLNATLASHVLVATPQILVNMLRNMRRDLRLYICDITMLILDECHHTDKNHPYNELMTMVHEYKYEKPQIVAMTASIGVGQVTKAETATVPIAHTHVVKTCARLGISRISMVRKNVEDLRQFVPTPIDEISKVSRPDPTDPTRSIHSEFQAALKLAFYTTYKQMQTVIVELKKPNNGHGVSIPLNQAPAQYDLTNPRLRRADMDTLKSLFSKIVTPRTKIFLNRGVQFCKLYLNCLMMWDVLPARMALEELKLELAKVIGDPGCPFAAEYRNKYEALLDQAAVRDPPTPILIKLRELICHQLRTQRGSRVIVFVTERLIARRLTDYLNELGDAEAVFLTSTVAPTRLHGMTPTTQAESLAKFRSGRAPIMVSTSVVEEGLDVPECNLIIKYNNTGNITSLIQRRGRARAHNSRSVLLCVSNDLEERELNNYYVERVLNRTLQNIEKNGTYTFEREVRMQMEAFDAERKRERDEENRRKDLLQGRMFEMCCRDCNRMFCVTSQLRSMASHYFMMFSDVWDMVNVTTSEGKMIDQDTWASLGDIKCKGEDGEPCNRYIGSVIYYAGCYLPQVKPQNVQFKEEGLPDWKTYKKWAETYNDFYIEHVEDENDLSEMVNALYDNDKVLFNKLEAMRASMVEKEKQKAIREKKKEREKSDEVQLFE